MTRLGDLERAVMDVLWDWPDTTDPSAGITVRGAAGSAGSAGITVREVAEALRDRGLAYTTVMTVLDRLAGKGMVERERTGRAWSYRPAATREAHIAGLMLDALDLAGSRDAALVRFARSVSGTEAEVLRAALTAEATNQTTASSAADPAAPGTTTDPAPPGMAAGPAMTDAVAGPRPTGADADRTPSGGARDRRG